MTAALTDDARHKHELVRRHLLDTISHELAPRQRLPSERELATRLGVSRPTVRRALDQMAAEGRVHRVHGAGTFVADAPDRLPPATKLLSATETTAGAARSWKLAVSPNEPLWHVERLRLVDDLPMCLESVFVVKALAPDLLARDLEQPLHDPDTIRRAEQSITATVLDAPQAEILDVPELSPALLIETVSYDRRGRRLEYAQTLCRGDRYKFELTL